MKAREAMSAMSLCSPGMCNGVNEDARRSRMRRWRKRRSAPATEDVVVEPFLSQDMADVLSAKIPTCLYSKVVKSSSVASHPKTMPASSRSLIVRTPLSNRALMSVGHSYCHTTGGIVSFPDTMTPPEPNLHASVYSIMFGNFGISSWMGVGCRLKCWTIARQSSSARRKR